jgi:thymidylate synthase (FAD)
MRQTKFSGMDRPRSKQLDKILGIPFRVLDDGFIRVVDYMGTDRSIVQAARVSYGAGTSHDQNDRNLIRYLMRHRHTTPFEMCEIKLHIRVPMDTWRQWIRHRTANVNEYSTRYSVAIDAAQKTAQDCWRLQEGDGKAASHAIGERLSAEESEFQTLAHRVYQHRLEVGIAREQARKDLPLSTYTEAYWKIDLHNLLHFLRLRMNPKAQKEIRLYATVISTEIVKRWCPETWKAFVNYRLKGLELSETEVRIISAMGRADNKAAIAIAAAAGWLHKDETAKKNRELLECEEKLLSMDLRVPWSRSKAQESARGRNLARKI